MAEKEAATQRAADRVVFTGAGTIEAKQEIPADLKGSETSTKGSERH